LNLDFYILLKNSNKIKRFIYAYTYQRKINISEDKMINENMIYPFAYSKENLILPDVTAISNYNKNITSNFKVVKSDNVLFPDAANNLKAAKKLKDILKNVQEDSKEEGYSIKAKYPELKKFEQFGIQPGTKDIVELILTKYVEVCREKRKAKLGFGPGIQYNFSKLGNEGIEVILGNYGTFAATLLKAAENPDYKKFLIGQGERLLGNRQGFFVNPPAINAICESSDGYILIANRGPTAEYDRMYHNIAAGHQDDKKWGKAGDIIPLENLVAYQINREVGLPKKDLIELNFNGIAFSAGYDERIIGTEKIELLAYTKLNKTVDEIAESMKTAKHSWETRQLLAVPREKINDFIKRTSDAKKQVGDVWWIKTYFNLDVQPGTDPNSKSYWVPVGLSNLIVWTRVNPYILD